MILKILTKFIFSKKSSKIEQTSYGFQTKAYLETIEKHFDKYLAMFKRDKK